MSTLLIATLAWGALTFGGVYEWAYAPLLIVWAMLGLAGLVLARGRHAAPIGWSLPVSLLITALAIVVQLIPLRSSTLEHLSPATDALLRQLSLAYSVGATASAENPHPLSVQPVDTLIGLAFFASLGLLLLGLARSLRRKDVLTIVHGVIVLGVALAFIGLIQKATYNGRVYGVWEPSDAASPFGPFINYNHFAGWMLMAIPLALGCLCGRVRRVMRRADSDWRSRRGRLSSPEASQATLIAAAVLVMALSLFFTLSRSGMIGFFLATAILAWWIARQQAVRSRRLVAVGYLLLLSGLSVGWVGTSAIVDRFAAVAGSNLGNRLGAWQDALGVITDFPFTGTGLNTYGIVMLFYQQHDMTSRYLQAHNDYLQILAEGGLLVAIPALASLVLFALVVRRRFREGASDSTLYWLRVGAVTGLVAVGLQETVDFSLQLPGNAALFTVLCAIAITGCRDDRGIVGPTAARTDHLFARYYYTQLGFRDGTTAFHRLCGHAIGEGSAILEIGAGPSNATTAYFASIGTIVGLDVSDEILANTHVASAWVYDGVTFPFDGGSFDACASNYVLEHIADPDRHFKEVARVLKPGGVYCFRTPNLWHYVALVSRLLPHAVHKMVANRLRALDHAHEPYPTFYRANSRAVIRRLAGAAGLLVETLPTIEAEPWYGRSHALLFYPMMAYERLVNSSPRFDGFRANVLGVLRKPIA